ncbi:Acyl-CoA dehydrogenase (plasmid) [Variovorax sp. SRS16]|uniref:acyl-CoA dehydrogenase family protein n=1 Tax=Variovorax sp. SRS16 TaxID=282217 RepID=UPI001319A030|nr:acyl-CoA dehydrogenase family protein [Variovorax sp. SRS16]VTU45772.1 Acyl-CoA dehydrogenase [Variovorax sp. SRS16]
MNTADQDVDIATLLRDSARDFAAGERDHGALRARAWNPALPGFDTAAFAQMQALGWRGMLVAEAQGGAGLGLREAAAVAQELGRSLLGEPFVATAVLPVTALLHAAVQPQAVALLGDVASGAATLALAWQEQPASIAADAIRTEAWREGNGFVISGRKGWVAGGAAATALLVSARIDEGVGVFHVPPDAPGVRVSNSWQTDGTPSIAVALDHVAVEADALVAAPAHGRAVLAQALDAAVVAASAELLGVAHEAFDMTLAYMRTRVQFGQPIGSFQALQHKAVDLLVQRELAAAVLDEALAAFADDACTGPERSRIASRCKARCSDAALRITRECIQLHGAIGYTHESDIGLYLKRALVLSAWLGNAAQHRRRHVELAVP